MPRASRRPVPGQVVQPFPPPEPPANPGADWAGRMAQAAP